MFDKLKELVASLEQLDGTVLKNKIEQRKILQDIKSEAQQVRVAILNGYKTPPKV